jgi:hypothetical protein
MDTGHKEKIPIKYIPWGIGNVMEGTIYLNTALKKKEWTELRKKVLEHELSHGIGEGYVMKDAITDFSHTTFDLDILLFLAQTPSAWVQFSPVWIYNKKLFLDKHLLILYGVIVGSVCVGWWLF